MEPRLKTQVAPLEQALRRTRLRRQLALCWIAAAGLGIVFLLLQPIVGLAPLWIWLAPLAAGAGAATVLVRRDSRRSPDFRALIEAVKRSHPEVRHLFATALEQEPDPATGRFGYLQQRVVDETLVHPAKASWERYLERTARAAGRLHAVALAGFLAVLVGLGYCASRRTPFFGSWISGKITVSPGDVTLERGTGLVILARFGHKTPAEATLVLISAGGQAKRIPMQRELSDPVFGTSLAEVTDNGAYHIEYGSQRTRDYRITVFEYPELQRADATLAYPAYTGLTNQLIPDTRRLSAVEGTRLTYLLLLNKPAARARFLGGAQSLPLAVESNATALLQDFLLAKSARYSLELVDGEGRTNKVPADFSFQVLPNRRPELKLTFPRGDPRVSKLEEIQLQGQAIDDFGLLKYGIGYGLVGHEPRLVELGSSGAANQTRRFEYVLPLEKLGVDEAQVISYFVWADDYGPDGKSRRTFSDLFFAEVRPFEEVFRQDESGMPASGNQNPQENGAAQLAQAQKEIVIATWKLQQDKAAAATPAPP